jgi:hypothetical protein
MDTPRIDTIPIPTPTLISAGDIEKELLDSILVRYEPTSRVKKEKDNSTREMIKELERIMIDLSLTIEEKKINDYFDKQYRIYLVEQMNVSPFFATRIAKYINLVKNGNIRVITDKEIESGEVEYIPKLFMPQRHSEFIVSIESRTFLNSILDTYESDTDIINQFLRDFFRQIVTINDIVYNNIDDLLLELSASNRKTNIRSKSGKPISTMMLLLLITCQSSHYLSYLYSHNAITDIRDMITAFDPEGSDPRTGYFVMNSNEFNVTNIWIDHIDVRPEVGCIIDSTYKIFDTNNCEKIYDIKAKTIFNESSDRCMICYNITKCH